MSNSRDPVSAIFPSPESLYFMMTNNCKFIRHALLAFCLYNKVDLIWLTDSDLSVCGFLILLSGPVLRLHINDRKHIAEEIAKEKEKGRD